ncbi:hypothetical protein [Ferrigenium sp. UT5]|uniref:hypothetical protein n=1 Tax=Ferrigenium sp. UT5 TaxID=3242105 RepID=UPI0035512B9C
MTHYFIGQLGERNGDYEYKVPVRFTAASEKEASNALTKTARNWYGDYSQKDGDCYYFHSGEVCVQAGGYKEVPESVYTALNGFVAEAT